MLQQTALQRWLVLPQRCSAVIEIRFQANYLHLLRLQEFQEVAQPVG